MMNGFGTHFICQVLNTKMANNSDVIGENVRTFWFYTAKVNFRQLIHFLDLKSKLMVRQVEMIATFADFKEIGIGTFKLVKLY